MNKADALLSITDSMDKSYKPHMDSAKELHQHAKELHKAIKAFSKAAAKHGMAVNKHVAKDPDHMEPPQGILSKSLSIQDTIDDMHKELKQAHKGLNHFEDQD